MAAIRERVLARGARLGVAASTGFAAGWSAACPDARRCSACCGVGSGRTDWDSGTGAAATGRRTAETDGGISAGRFRARRAHRAGAGAIAVRAAGQVGLRIEPACNRQGSSEDPPSA